ncbi:hypothetical protein GCM10022393_35690 [Aquimarina addita]|uniref:Uncharacterized protein n=1 Tax=Aquimarina addita TaxID=870485 RepID=A0ABP6URF8_9FLAO
MTKWLPNTLFIILSIITTTISAQEVQDVHNHSDAHPSYKNTLNEDTHNHEAVLKEITYNVKTFEEHITPKCDHNQSNTFNQISLIDIISSDAGADFNCSGGFCMNKLHYHKKGLTLKRQLFDYFMKISG